MGHHVVHRARILGANRLGMVRADCRAGTPPGKTTMSLFQDLPKGNHLCTDPSVIAEVFGVGLTSRRYGDQ
jgi:hypothetical protein